MNAITNYTIEKDKHTSRYEVYKYTDKCKLLKIFQTKDAAVDYLKRYVKRQTN